MTTWLKTLERIPTRDMTREQWLAERRKRIGGSDAAAVLGLSRYASPYTVFLNKTGRADEAEDNEAMRIGRDLEDYVAKRWMEETGKKVRRENAILINPTFPFAHANVDRLVVGEEAGLECKTTSSLDLRQFRGVEFPERYYVQCVHYMAVTGAKRWYLAVLVLGREFHTYTLERDEEEIAALMRVEKSFWEDNVLEDSAPMPDGSPATSEALTALYPESNGESVKLFGREGILNERADLLRQEKEIETRINEIENILKDELGENERGEAEGWKISWKTQSRRTFQAKDFSKAHPELDLNDFYKETTSRPFKITEVKEPA